MKSRNSLEIWWIVRSPQTLELTWVVLKQAKTNDGMDAQKIDLHVVTKLCHKESYDLSSR